MKPSRTQYLILLLAIGFFISMWALNNLASAQSQAIFKSESLQIVRGDIADLRGAQGTESLTQTQHADLTGRVRAAAISAGVADQLLSIETGQESRDAGGLAYHAPLYLRFNAMSLEQLDSFLQSVSAEPEGAAVGNIDLSIPQASLPAAKQNAETWAAAITLSQDVSIQSVPTR